VPPALSAAIANQDSRLLLIIAGAALSLAAMAAITATRVDALDAWFPLHIDASGDTTRWGSESALWRLPFGVAMLTLMNVISAFLLGLRDRRVAWLFIGSLPLIHILGWIALILIAW
jgi:ABC-type antimicrobial peptide transport system permease subunit